MPESDPTLFKRSSKPNPSELVPWMALGEMAHQPLNNILTRAQNYPNKPVRSFLYNLWAGSLNTYGGKVVSRFLGIGAAQTIINRTSEPTYGTVAGAALLASGLEVAGTNHMLMNARLKSLGITASKQLKKDIFRAITPWHLLKNSITYCPIYVTNHWYKKNYPEGNPVWLSILPAINAALVQPLTAPLDTIMTAKMASIAQEKPLSIQRIVLENIKNNKRVLPIRMAYMFLCYGTSFTVANTAETWYSAENTETKPTIRPHRSANLSLFIKTSVTEQAHQTVHATTPIRPK